MVIHAIDLIVSPKTNANVLDISVYKRSHVQAHPLSNQLSTYNTDQFAVKHNQKNIFDASYW